MLTASTSIAQDNLPTFIITIKRSRMLRSFTSSAKDKFPTFNFTVIRSRMISACMNLLLLLQFPDIYCYRQTKPNVTGISSAKDNEPNVTGISSAKDNEPKVIGMCLLRSRQSPDISFTVKRSRILTAFTSTAQNNLSIFIMIKLMERNVTDIHVFRERQISDI